MWNDIENFFTIINLKGFWALDWGWKMFFIFGGMFVLFTLLTVFQTIIGTFAILMRFREVPVENIYTILKSNSLPVITFLIPAFNESKDIVYSVKNALSLSYRYKKIIVINDGSTDNTLDLLVKNFNLRPVPITYPGKLPTSEIRGFYASTAQPDLLVIDKVNGGKADALNIGLNACTSNILVAMDADSLIDDTALNRLIRPFLLYPDTVAAHAAIGHLNGCTVKDNRIVKIQFPKSLLLGFQAIEFMRGFVIERLGLSWTKGALVIPGNFGMFKLDVLQEIGGYDRTSIVEDTEIITRMHKYLLDRKRPYQITYIPDIVAWTEAPKTLINLKKQRMRWYKGTTQNIWDYRNMWFRPKYRSVGMYVMPLTIWEKIAPLFEIVGLAILIYVAYYGLIDPYLVIAMASVGWVFGIILILETLIVEFVAYETYKEWSDFRSILKCTLFYTLYHYLLLYYRIISLYAPKSKRAGWTPIREGFEDIHHQ